MTPLQELRRKAIRETAEWLTVQDMYIYINLDTWEVCAQMKSSYYDDNEEESKPDWENKIVMEPLEAPELFKIMQRFVFYELPEGKFQRMMEMVLELKKPFANFNHQIHNSQYMDKWFSYRAGKLEEYVKSLVVLHLKGGMCDKNDLEEFYPTE